MDAQDRAIQKLAKELAGIKREVVSWRGPQADYTSLENSGNFTFKDSDGNVTAVVGGQDDGSNTIRHVDGPVPPIPSGLSAHVDGPIVQVSWGGTFETDVTHDWHYLEVLAVGPSNEQLTGTIDNADGGSTSLAATSQGDWVVVARSVSRAGKRSLDGDAGTVAVQLVGLTGAIEAVQASADGKNTIYYSATMPPGTDYVEGDLWFDTSEEGNNRASVWDGAEWLSVADGRVTDIAAAQDVLDANQEALDGRLDDAFGQIEDAIISANGKNVVHYEDAPPTESDPGVEGDTWFVGEFGRPTDVVEATNLAVNPSFTTLNSPMSAGTMGAGGGATLSIDSSWSVSGGTSLKVSPETSSASSAYPRSNAFSSPDGDWAGRTVTVSATVRLASAQTGSLDGGARKIVIGYRNANADFIWAHASSEQPPNAPGEYRVSATATFPADDFGSWFIRLMNGSASVPVWWDAFDVAEVSTARPYFDGDTTDGATNDDPHYRWTDTPHASTSEKYLPATEGLSSNWNVTEQYRYVNGAWENVELSHTVLSSLDVGKLVAGSAAIKEAVVQKLFAEVVVAKMVVADEFIGENAILTGAVTADKMAVGSITAESGIIESLDLGTATVGELDGIRIMGQTIRGQQLSGDAIDGKVITGGTYRTTGGSGSWSDDGLFIAQPDGTSMVRFPTDGSPLSLTASDVQIDRASITDLDLSYGSVRSGGEITLASGVQAPVSPPELTTGWQKVCTLEKTGAVDPTSQLPYRFNGFGYWAEGAGHWVRAVNVLSSGTWDRVELYDAATGEVERYFLIDCDPDNGLTVMGDIVYVFGNAHGSGDEPLIDGYNLVTGARVSRHEYTRSIQAKNALGNDGTNLIVASVYNRRLYVHRRNPVTGVQVGPDMRSGSNSWPSASDGRLYGVSINGSELTVVPAETARVYTINGGTLTRKTDTSNASGFAGWDNPNKNGAGVVWRDGLPYLVDGVGNVYKGSPFASDAVLEVCFVWTNGTYFTTPSPIATIDQVARQETTISLPVRAGLSKRVYTRTAGAANWAKYDIAENVTAARVSGGFQVETLPTTNTFPNASPATLKSTNNKFEVKGDGSGRWGPLTFNANGTVTGPESSGQTVITPPAANTVTSVEVTLPVGRFKTAPEVSLTPYTGSPHQVSVGAWPISRDSFTLNVHSTTTDARRVGWQATDSQGD